MQIIRAIPTKAHRVSGIFEGFFLLSLQKYTGCLGFLKVFFVTLSVKYKAPTSKTLLKSATLK